MGKQINASILYIMNEVELSIYRFLISRIKKNKKTASTSRAGGQPDHYPLEHLMIWQVTIASTGPQPEVDREGGYLDREGKTTG